MGGTKRVFDRFIEDQTALRFLITISLIFTYLSGCDVRYHVTEMDASQLGWDSLQVSASFEEKAFMQRAKPHSPDSVFVMVYDARYDTLYHGPAGSISIPDGDLGNQERILVEMCGYFEEKISCDQRVVHSSPKRIRVDPDIVYPVSQNIGWGRFSLPFVVERKKFENEEWQRVTRQDQVTGYLQAYVEGKPENTVEIPFKTNKGDFDVVRHRNGQQFKFQVQSALKEEQETQVVFDVFVDLNGEILPAASLSRGLRHKTDNEHLQVVASYAEHAADLIAAKLSPFSSGRRSVVYIDTWLINRFKQRYMIDVEVRWSSSTFVRNRYRLNGRLEVDDDGKNPVFTLIDADRRSQMRWNNVVEGDQLELPTLDAVNRTLSGITQPFVVEDGLLVIEAEAFQNQASSNAQQWVINQDVKGYAGDGAVVAIPDQGQVYEGRDIGDSPELTYLADFDQSGVYYVWLRVWSSGDRANSLHVGLDGELPRTGERIEVRRFRQWTWTRAIRGRRGEARLVIDQPGMHSLHLWMREDGLLVDRILLTRDPDFRPDGVGPRQSILAAPAVEDEAQDIPLTVIP